MIAITQTAELTCRQSSLSPGIARAVLLLLIIALVTASFLSNDATTSARAISAAGPDLTRLLRMMAVLKAAIAVGLSAAVFWRLGVMVTPAWLAAYSVLCGVMAAGPMLIWNMTHIVAGTLLLHGGLLAVIVLLWRDPAVGGRLATLLAYRQSRLLR